MVIRHPPDRSIYMQSLLQFLKGTVLKEKKLLENTTIRVLCLPWLHLFIPLHLLRRRGRLEFNGIDLGRLGMARDEKNNQDRWKVWAPGSYIFHLLLLHPGAFSSRAHGNCLEQSDSDQLLQFFTKSKMAWFGISDSILYLKSVESMPESNWQGMSGIVQRICTCESFIERTMLSLECFKVHTLRTPFLCF